MKRNWILLALSLIIGTAGFSASTQEAGSDVVEVNIFQFKVEIAQELEAAAKLYESQNPSVKIVIETVGGGDDYGAALRAKRASVYMRDIYNVGGSQDVKDW